VLNDPLSCSGPVENSLPYKTIVNSTAIAVVSFNKRLLNYCYNISSDKRTSNLKITAYQYCPSMC